MRRDADSTDMALAVAVRALRQVPRILADSVTVDEVCADALQEIKALAPWAFMAAGVGAATRRGKSK